MRTHLCICKFRGSVQDGRRPCWHWPMFPSSLFVSYPRYSVHPLLQPWTPIYRLVHYIGHVATPQNKKKVFPLLPFLIRAQSHSWACSRHCCTYLRKMILEKRLAWGIVALTEKYLIARERARLYGWSITPASVEPTVSVPDSAAPTCILSGINPRRIQPKWIPHLILVSCRSLHDHLRRFTPPYLQSWLYHAANSPACQYLPLACPTYTHTALVNGPHLFYTIENITIKLNRLWFFCFF